MSELFFRSWSSIYGILIVGVLAYVTLVLFLRIAGNRTLSKLNVFDLIVTVSLGSTLGTVVISRDVSLADGATAFALLIGLQFVVTWTSVRAPWIRKMVTGEPVMLLYRGSMLPGALRKSRVAEDEVLVALRGAGMTSLAEAEAVILETDGSLTVVKSDGVLVAATLEGVKRL